MRSLFTVAVLCGLSLVACAPEAEDAELSSDPMVQEETEDEAKADRAALVMAPLMNVDIPENIATTETRRVITSAAGFRSLLGVPAPETVDFSRRWVVFYSAGVKRTGGYKASILSIRPTDSGLTLKVTTRLSSPAPGCPVLQVLTRPYALVSIPRPQPTPVYARYYRSDETYTCR
jgi:hypothetical protein